MKIPIRPCLLAVALLSTLTSPLSTLAQGTAFTYQGRLNDGANPASGSYDLRFTIYDSTNSPGTIIAGPLTNAAAAVSNGLFTVTLDFGTGVFTGEGRWLEIGVRQAGSGSFAALSPRQSIASTPYAIQSGNAASAVSVSGAVSAAQLTGTIAPANIANGSIGSNLLAAGVVTSDKIGGVLLPGQIPDLDAGKITSGTVAAAALGNAWKTGGNAGTTPGTHFLGTTDKQPLEFRVNGQRALRLEYVSVGLDTEVNVIGGSSDNSVSSNVQGATIAGGGSPSNPNQVSRSFGTVGGGEGNTASAWATVAGGSDNTANGLNATIGGGDKNTTNGNYATIPGGDRNTATFLGFASGRRAKANHQGSFVWADSTDADFASTTTNQFNMRASGGARFVTGGAGLTVDGNVGIGTTNPVEKLRVEGSILRAATFSPLYSRRPVPDMELTTTTARTGWAPTSIPPAAGLAASVPIRCSSM